MSNQLNRAGDSFAGSLISAGKYNASAGWSFAAADGNALLGPKGEDWATYGKCHLGINSIAIDKTKDRYKYPFAKKSGGEILAFRSGLIAAKQRAAQQGDSAIEAAADRHIQAIDKKENEDTKSMRTKTIPPGAMMKLHAAAASPTGCARPESLFGLWAIEPRRFGEMVAQAKALDLLALARSRAQNRADGTPSGPLPTLSPERPGKKKGNKSKADDLDIEEDDEEADIESDDEIDTPEMDDLLDDDSEDGKPYQVINGIAVFGINGPMTKYQTSFQDILGGTATVPLRRAIRMASRDPDVTCGVLCIDSPGGTAAGMTDLAEDIRAFDAQKPCYAFIQDMGCSAAYWAASQCRTIYANAGALVGCIGTMAVLHDTSKAYEQKGVTVHVITNDTPDGSTMKGAAAEGAPITSEQISDFKRQINEQNDLFVADVAAGRKMTPNNVRDLADGRVHVGDKAKALGLVDDITSFDAAMQAIYAENYQMNSDQFKAFASANPEDAAVKSLIASGHKVGRAEGHTESRAELASILAAFPGREKFAAEQFVKGHDVLTAKAELADVLAAELSESNRRLAEQATAAAAASNENGGVRLPVGGAAARPGSDDPIGRFETAWKQHTQAGMSVDRAIAKVVTEQPDLHESYLAAVQAARKPRQN